MHWTYQVAHRIVFPVRPPSINKTSRGIVGKQPTRRRFGAPLDIRFWRGLCADPIRVALDAAPARRRFQHSDLDAAVLVPRAFLDPSRGSGFERGRSVRRYWTALSRGRHPIEFRVQPPDGTEHCRHARWLVAAVRRAAGGDAAARD